MNSLTSVIIKNGKRKELTTRSALLGKLSFLIVFVFLSAIMVVISRTATLKLEEIGQGYAFVNMLLFMNFIIVFTESIFHSLNTLYFSKDLKVFLRMPIKPKNLVNSKMLDIIYSEYQMEILMLAIPMIVYGVITKVTLPFYLYMAIILLILPAIPIAITTLIVATIMRFTNFMKNKTKAMYVTIVIALFILSLLLSNSGTQTDITVSGFEKWILQTNGLAEEVANRFILIKPIMNTLLNYNNIKGLVNLLIYILESFAIYKLAVFIVSKLYLKGAIGTVVSGQKNKKNMETLSLKDLKKHKASRTYLLKELKFMLRSPIFFIQCILLPIIDPIILIVVVISFIEFAQGLGIDVWSVIYEKANTPIIYATFFAIGQAFFMLNFSSIIAVSKEGKSSIMMKTMPIALDKQFKLKTIIGKITNIFPILIIAVSYYLCTHNWLYSIMLLVGLLLLSSVGEKYKLLIDLKKPQIKWDTEYTMMKQNTNVMYELFYTIIVFAIIMIIGLTAKNIPVVGIILITLLTIINLIINKYISDKKEIIFGNLY